MATAWGHKGERSAASEGSDVTDRWEERTAGRTTAMTECRVLINMYECVWFTLRDVLCPGVSVPGLDVTRVCALTISVDPQVV